MTVVASSDLAPIHLRLMAAAASWRLEEVYSEQAVWESLADQAALRHALQRAAGKGRLQNVRLLLEWGADVNAHGGREVSPLFKAVEGRHPRVAFALLEYKADLNWRRPKDGISALFMACLHTLDSVVFALLRAGMNPNARDNEGRTPLLYMVSQKSKRWSYETFKVLVHHGADIEARDRVGKTALLQAAANNHEEAIEALLNGSLGRIADVSARNNRGLTALYLAAEKHHTATVNTLLRHGADPQAVGNGGWTPLHPVAREGYEDVLKMLLQAGATVNAQLSNGMTPLHWAAMNGHEHIVKLLLAEPHVNPDIKDTFNRTPMLCAALRGHRDIALLLSPIRTAHRLSAPALAACKGFEAMIIDFGKFRKRRLRHRHSIYDLLYGWDTEKDQPSIPLSPKKVRYQPDLRWIHLPANNVIWVETLLAKLLAEGDYQDIESFRSMTEHLDQEQHAPLDSSHSMRPFCQRVIPSRSNSSDRGLNPEALESINVRNSVPDEERRSQTRVDRSVDDTTPGSVVLYMPFIHFETHERYRQMNVHIAKARRREPFISVSSPDAALVHGYLNNERPLHIRRTLDQYDNTYLDTSMRDPDQLVARFGRTHSLEIKMLMVDQLWLWVIGEDLVLSCFAERWEQPNTDPLNVRYSILDALNSEQNIRSNYHLATLIVSHCCNIFDSSWVGQDYQFLSMFDVTTKALAERQTRLLQEFSELSQRSSAWLQSSREHHAGSMQMTHEGHDYVLDALLQLSEEPMVFNEASDIRDELSTIEDIIGTQNSILKEFESVVIEEFRQRGQGGPDENGTILQLKGRWRALGRRINTRQRDLERMNRRVENTHSSLRSLLELKQMQSNALETKFSRNQAVTTSKQGQAVLVFTIVTIIFLPMSFIATLFTVELSDWPSPLTLAYIAKYTFGIGLGISIPLVIVAMTVSDVVATLKGFIFGKNRLLGGWT